MSERAWWLLLLAGAAAAWWWSQPAAAVPRARLPGPWAPALPGTPPSPELEEVFVTRWTTPPAGYPYEADFIAASAAYDLPPGLLSRVAYQESRYDPRAESPAGAQGIMQIVPYWHPGVDPWNPKEAIPYAASYLAKNARRFGSWSKALAAYNWGPTALANAIAQVGDDWRTLAPTETRRYVDDVTADTGVA